jgi:hypothetical protein
MKINIRRFILAISTFLFCAVGASAAEVEDVSSINEFNSICSWTKLPENPFYVLGGGGYIASENFHGGMTNGILGWNFANGYGCHSLELEVIGAWEEAKAITADYLETDRRKTNLNQILTMVNYRYRLDLGDTPWFFYLGGGLGCDFMTTQDEITITFNEGSPSTHPRVEKHYTSFAWQGFTGLGYSFTLWNLSWMASGGGRLIGTKRISVGGLMDTYVDLFSPRVSTGSVHWSIEGALGLQF